MPHFSCGILQIVALALILAAPGVVAAQGTSDAAVARASPELGKPDQ
jgi:hypothetical protein